MTKESMTSEGILRLFNEKADKLINLSFTQAIREHGNGLSFDAVDGQSVGKPVGPSEEAIDAFVLTLRFFIQDNERTSIANIEKLYQALPVSEEIRNHVVEGRAAINTALDLPSHVVLSGNTLGTREIFEVFLYGGLAHANAQQKAVYDEWRTRGDLFIFLRMEFIDTMIQLLNFIVWLANFNDATLLLLAKQDDA
jgi:hypothetical protein